ncbi:DEAD/DEAH box helicase [Paenibacillus sp. HB172176]|uniref:DEAD/DEAH box helicase n=1 Tax=Paenibacillus sp. HB172176 TaxID=2493690 RepID=UPI001438A4A5|nr:DEAD/DEAH box helicase [Paenibacillus sp. HB172176]
MLMGASLPKSEIKEICGSTFYTRGQNYQLMRKVRKLSYNPELCEYTAEVKGSRTYQVSAIIDEDGEAHEIVCNCPAYFEYDYYCKHVAAVLLEIEELVRLQGTMGQASKYQSSQAKAMTKTKAKAVDGFLTPSSSHGLSSQEKRIANELLSLFGSNSATLSRSAAIAQNEHEEMKVEFICHISTGYAAAVSVELKVGPSRVYVVQKITDFLTKLSEGQPHSFTKLFILDPSKHRFRKQDEEALQLLQSIGNVEQSYRQRSGYYYGSRHNERSLYIPPAFWDTLLERLRGTETTFLLNGQSCPSLDEQDDSLPAQFRLTKGRTPDQYLLEMEGLDRLQSLPAYGLVLSNQGKWYRMNKSEIDKLERMKKIIQPAEQGKIAIAASHVNDYVNQVIPELRHFGKLTIDPSVEEAIVSEPLQAKVYLDAREDALTAKVEFHYGRHILHPGRTNEKMDGGAVVMRQQEEELEVLLLLKQAGFKESGSMLLLHTEQEQYSFLYERLEALQEIAEVFATNAVKSMQVPRSVLPKLSVDMDEGMDWLHVTFDMEDVDQKELLRLLQSIREKKTYHRLSDGAFVSLEDEGFRQIGELFDNLGITKSELKSGAMRLPLVRGLALTEATSGELAHVKLGKSFKRLLSNLNNPDNLDFEPPGTLTSILRDYQSAGFQWMKTLSYYGFGGILADDMGLGKTLQSIAYLLSEREARGERKGSSIIICPASLVYNWKHELARFAPELNCLVMTGSRSEREAILGEGIDADVIITSYPLLRRDADLYEHCQFHCMILDEAQAIKNHATQTAQSVKAISAAHRFALTGTPVENRLEELWSIYSAVFPELFAGKKSFSDLTPEQVARKIRPFMLRRLKRDVLTELPDKIETLQTTELLPEQKKLYMAYLLQLKQETAQQLEAEGFQRSRMKILAGLTRLRQLCCHPSLFVENYDGGSGKLEQLLELVEECKDGGRRMLIFSQFTGMLSILREELNKRGRSYFYLDGSTKSSERVELCKQFNDGERDMFLISLKAGGTGLNLTGADTVILYDLWWNPAVEQQAADRAHRMGQKNVVQVIRMMTEGTIEEKMYELQQQKRDLIDKVVQPGEEQLSSLSEQDIRELLAL